MGGLREVEPIISITLESNHSTINYCKGPQHYYDDYHTEKDTLKVKEVNSLLDLLLINYVQDSTKQ
jgi:hypothetical protein